jgi:hypothetical protein
MHMCQVTHFDQEECVHVSIPETDSDGDNMTASDDSDADSEQGGGGLWSKKWTNLNTVPPLGSRHRKHNIVTGTPGLIAYGENISSLSATL